MKVVGVIPARWGATRFEGKILAPIAGKPMIQHVWERSRQSQKLDDVLIACDDERILSAAKEFGAQAILTSQEHSSGTDRIIEVIQDLKVDVVINIQGDEPLIHHSVIDALATAMSDDPSVVMATVIKGVEKEEELSDSNVVKVVIDRDQNALYFSRCLIPYNRSRNQQLYYKHIGIYAYQKDFLCAFKKLPKRYLEEAERLEQLRVLESGCKIKTIVTDREMISVDTPEDVNRVEIFLNHQGTQNG